MSMLRIIFDDEIFTSQFSGGVSRAFTELGEALVAIPDISVAVPFPVTANLHLGASTIFHGRALGPRWRLPGLRRVLRAINRQAVTITLARAEADVVQATWYDTSLFDRVGGVPVVATVHDMLPELMPEAVPAGRTVHGDKLAFLPRARLLIAVSETTAAALCRLTGISRDSVRVIHHGVSERVRWPPGHGRPSRLPESFLLFVGRREGYKNFLGAAPSVARLLRRNAAMHFVCVGAGGLAAEELEPFIQARVADRVHQIEADDELLAGCYAHAEAFLFPSRYEGFGLPLLEAMINRCPVISSNGGALPEVADDAALYFDPAQPEALVELVETLRSDRRQRDKLVAAGLLRVADFSWSRTAAKYAAAYSELI
jgi:glycosyltransferase involved in cell wall biosynthesis